MGILSSIGPHGKTETESHRSAAHKVSQEIRNPDVATCGVGFQQEHGPHDYLVYRLLNVLNNQPVSYQESNFQDLRRGWLDSAKRCLLVAL